MALSCSRLSNNLSLLRLLRLQSHQITTGISSPCFCQQTRCYSTSEVRRGIGRYVTTSLQWVNGKYENFLKKRFPRYYLLYHTFVEGKRISFRRKLRHTSGCSLFTYFLFLFSCFLATVGFKLLFRDAKDVRDIKIKMSKEGIAPRDLSYREMEKLRQFRRDVLKGIPIVLLSIPPFANYLVLLLMYFYPRQVLTRHFWTPKQQVEFRQLYHSQRIGQHPAVIQELRRVSAGTPDGDLRSRLEDLCTQVQKGKTPQVWEILAVRGLFSGAPLGMGQLSVNQMRNLSPLLFLTPRLPGFLMGRRLTSHAAELLVLDRALGKLGPGQLSESELRQACYMRGLDSDRLGVHRCREWLDRWLRVSSSLGDSDTSLLLHCLVFLSAEPQNGAGGQ
ncbi:LETM1 domain-containing protein 1 [Stigmatopora nigra]